MTSSAPKAAAAAVAAAAATAASTKITTTTAATKTTFIPRRSIEASASLTRTFYLGHHHAALAKMRQSLSHVGLILECRDLRVPLSSWNPQLETNLAASPAERARIIVYTKRDLANADSSVIKALRHFHSTHDRNTATAVFVGGARDDDRRLLEEIKRVARVADRLTGLRALVVGMPNAGKSTLLNRLRAVGMNLRKAARTGSQPGVTRKLSSPVRVIPADTDGSDGVFILDTPGVFVPYASSVEAMLKLSLVGCVRDGLIPFLTVADYLLFHLNLHNLQHTYVPRFCAEPTNDVYEFLRGVATRTGKLVRGGEPSLEAAADWVIGEFRRGKMGRFVLDDVDEESLRKGVEVARNPPMSLSQAKKREKEGRKLRMEAKRLGQDGG